jgi:putative DNA primase/helicase
MSEGERGDGRVGNNVVKLDFWKAPKDVLEPPDDDGGGGGGDGGSAAPPGEDQRPIWASDDAMAQTLADQLTPDWRYVPARQEWLRWEGRRWEVDELMDVTWRARMVCRDVAVKTDPQKPSLRRAISSDKTIMAVARQARNDPRVRTSETVWDQDLYLLNTPGGVVDLRYGTLLPGQRDYLMTELAGAAPDGDCPHWRQFLTEATGGDQDYCDYLQRLVGYSLTGLTKEEIFAFLHGPSNTGKSKFVETIRLLHGTYARNAPMDAFTATQAQRHPTDLAGFVGKRLVTAAETEQGRRWDQQRLLTLTGQDKVSARFMRGDFFEYYPRFLLLFHGNFRPHMTNAGQEMRRRLRLLPFRVTPARIDNELIEKFKGELGGIMMWAVEGAVLYFNYGLQTPKIINDATAHYFSVENNLDSWIDEECDRSQEARATTRELYQSYVRYLKAAGEWIPNERRFAEVIENVLGNGCAWQHPVNRRRGFKGIALRHHNEEMAWDR